MPKLSNKNPTAMWRQLVVVGSLVAVGACGGSGASDSQQADNEIVLAAAGLDPKVIQERMGHSSIQTTLALYAQATEEGLKSASAVMATYLT